MYEPTSLIVGDVLIANNTCLNIQNDESKALFDSGGAFSAMLLTLPNFFRTQYSYVNHESDS